MQNKLPHVGEYLIGNPSYSPPEQISGKLVPQSDLYSLGVCCLYAVTAVEPIYLLDSNGQHWNYKHYLVENPLSSQLCQILEKMAAASKNDRYSSSEEILDALNQLRIYQQHSENGSGTLLSGAMNLLSRAMTKLTGH